MTYDPMFPKKCLVKRMPPIRRGERNSLGEPTKKPRSIVVYGESVETPCYWTYKGGDTTINIGGKDTRIDYQVNFPRGATVRPNDLAELDNGQTVRVVACGDAAGGDHVIARCTTSLAH